MRTLERRLQQDQKSDSKFSREQMPWGKGPCDSLFQAMVRMDPEVKFQVDPRGESQLHIVASLQGDAH